MKIINVSTFTIIVLLLITGAYSCKQKPRVEPTIIDFLVGDWTLPPNAKGFRTYEESWIKDNDSTYSGNAYAVNTKTNDRYNEELTWIKYREGNWIFVAFPKGQDTTEFSMTVMSGNKIRFENPEHDFPQYIQYTWYTRDTIVAEIGDTAMSKSFNMFRKN